MVRIPAEYQEVEYIQGNSNARIDTGISGNNDRLVISGKVYLNKFSAYQGFFGNYIDEDHNTTRLILGSSANGTVIVDVNRRAANSAVPNVGFYVGNTVEFKVSKTKLIFNGTEYTYAGVNNATANDTNIFFNVANPASVSSNSELYKRWYYFRINDGDTVLLNFIPCYRKSDNEPGMYDTVSGTFFTNQGTGTFLVGNDVSWDTASLIERRRQILLNTPHLTTASANPLTFQTDISTNLKDCKVYFEPVQEGEGDPSPDNVRPITGWDGIDIYHCGANLFPLTLPSTAFKGTFGTGGSSISNATYGRVWTMYVGKNQNLYYQHGGISPAVMFACSDKPLTTQTGAIIYNAINCTNRNNVIRNSGTHPYFVIAVANSSQLTPETGELDAASAMLSFGSTRKNYEKRTDPKLIIIPFPQTIYGGYVDLVKGEVVEEWGIVDLGTLTWNYNSSRKMFQTNFTSATSSPRKVICDHYKTVDSDYDKVDKTISLVQWTYPNGQINVSDYSFDGDAAAFKTAMNGVMAAYKMRSPVTHQLTPETIKTLKGANNIWSNANGNIEVRFWKH